MTDVTISPLRQRMIEDMTVRSFNPHTQRDYIRAVSKLAAFLGRRSAPPARRICAASNCTRQRAACSRRASTARLRRCVSSSR